MNGEKQTLTNAEDQTQDEQKLVAHIRTKVDEVRLGSSRVSNEAIWMTNTAYLLGFDNVYFDQITKSFKNVARPFGAQFNSNRAYVNRILPTIQNRLSRLTKNPPKFEVRPESMDTEDKDAARLGEDILVWLFEKQKMDEKRNQLVMLVQQCGHAYLKSCWDDTLGEPMTDPTTNEFSFEGDVRIEPVSAFEVFVDPLAKSLDDAAYLIHAKVRKLDYFKDQYPDRGHMVKEENAWLLGIQYEMRINSLNKSGVESSPTSVAMKNAAIELAYYERRSKKYPNGRLVITANGILLEDKELPIGEIPFSKFDDVVIGGKFAAEAIITHLRPVQDNINRGVQKRQQWLAMMLAGKILAPKGHGISKESFHNMSGEIVEWNIQQNAPGGGQPIPFQMPSIPQYAYEEEERQISHFNDISGIGEISRGNLPSAGIPAVGMQFLQEQDETRIGVVTGQHEHAYARTGSQILKYVQKYYEMPRKMKLAGGMEYAVKEFVGSDLMNNHDVIVVRGSTIPTSKALRRQEIMNAYGQGILGMPQDPKVQQKVMADMEFGDTAELWKKYSLDMAQIHKSIDMIEEGTEPSIHELDNHVLFVTELNEYRISDKYDAMDVQSKALLEKFLEGHIQYGMKLTNPGLDEDQAMAESMVKSAQDQDNEPINESVAKAEAQVPPPGSQPPPVAA